MAGIEVDTEEWKREAVKLLGAERRIVLDMRKELRAIGKPVGQAILEAYGHAMPHKGGLAERILDRGRVSILTDLRRGVRIQISNKLGMYMEQFEKGQVRHPVFGRWLPGQKPQKVPAGVGGKKFEEQADAMRKRVLDTLSHTLERQL